MASIFGEHKGRQGGTEGSGGRGREQVVSVRDRLQTIQGGACSECGGSAVGVWGVLWMCGECCGCMGGVVAMWGCCRGVGSVEVPAKPFNHMWLTVFSRCFRRCSGWIDPCMWHPPMKENFWRCIAWCSLAPLLLVQLLYSPSK